MTKTTASPATGIHALSTERIEASAARAYRIGKSFGVVLFDESGHPSFDILPEGTEVRLIGASRLSECLEVMYGNQLYNIFKVDLLGPWSSPILPIRSGQANEGSGLATC